MVVAAAFDDGQQHRFRHVLMDAVGRQQEGVAHRQREAAVVDVEVRLHAQGAGAIYASSRRRAQETARAVARDREVLVDALFIEAPLPPPHFPSWFKLPPKYWGVVARIWWHVLQLERR